MKRINFQNLSTKSKLVIESMFNITRLNENTMYWEMETQHFFFRTVYAILKDIWTHLQIQMMLRKRVSKFLVNKKDNNGPKKYPKWANVLIFFFYVIVVINFTLSSHTPYILSMCWEYILPHFTISIVIYHSWTKSLPWQGTDAKCT